MDMDIEASLAILQAVRNNQMDISKNHSSTEDLCFYEIIRRWSSVEGYSTKEFQRVYFL